MYQVVWLRLLSRVFGVTVHAASTGLASFRAGLAVESLVAGRLADRVWQPLSHGSITSCRCPRMTGPETCQAWSARARAVILFTTGSLFV
jgi:hypothetical protein